MMNMVRRAQSFRSNMTSKCQVTIPKAIRDALGLKAGDRVAFELSEDGSGARIVPLSKEDAVAAHKAKILAGVAEARRAFRHESADAGMSNAAYFDLMRGPPAER